VYGSTVRQSWPSGHCALLNWQRQRPEVAAGAYSQVEVSLMAFLGQF